MIAYLIILVIIVSIVIIAWLMQPYKNWKNNFDSRQYESIKIIMQDKSQLSLEQYKLQTQQKELSLVVPSYNEELRLPLMLQDVKKYIDSHQALSYEIIVVNDGSKDNTTNVAIQFANSNKLQLIVIEYPKNRGKGGAVRAGMNVAQGKYVLMVDADGATTFAEIDKVWSKLKQIEQKSQLVMVVGSRRSSQQKKVERKLHRKFVSWVFKFVIKLILGIQSSDTQCGFKLFTKDSADLLFKTLHIEKFAFDVELFFLCNNLKVSVGEVGVQWRDIDGSKLSVVDASVNMFRDVLMIRFYYLLGLWRFSDRVETK